MNTLLRGNFQLKKEVEVNEPLDEKKAFNDEFRKKALESIGGSMVFIEREKLFWDEAAKKDEE